MATEKKDRSWDGRSRPVNNKYRDNYDSIFGKREKTLHEAMMEGYEEEKKLYNDE